MMVILDRKVESGLWNFVGLHVAYDFHFASPIELTIFTDFVVRYAIQRHSPAFSTTIREHRDTIYWQRKRASVCAVFYADKPNRLTGDIYCGHLEIRLRRRITLRRFGIERPSDVSHTDFAEIFRRTIQFLSVNELGLQNAINRRAIARNIPASKAPTAALALHVGSYAAGRTGGPSAVAARAVCNSWLIPIRQVLTPFDVKMVPVASDKCADVARIQTSPFTLFVESPK
jgi:hypothetical protein